MWKHLPPGWKRREFIEIVRMETNDAWNSKSEKNARKKDHLERRHKPRKEEAEYRGIPISDEKLGEDDVKIEVLAYDVEVDENEKEYLKIPKSATDFVRIDEEKFKTSIQVLASKLRMGLREQDDNDSQGLDAQQEEDIKASHRVFDRENGVVDFRKKRVTEMAGCKRIKVPDAAETSKEAKLQVLINNLEDIVTKNGRKEEECLRAGKPQVLTLSEKARMGRASLRRREAAGELVFLGSDKCGRNAVMAKALYKECMEPHIAGDPIHTREDARQMENYFNGAATQILRSFKFGEDWSQEDRFKSACWVANNEIPSVNQVVKTHKTDLATRPVCRAPAKQAVNGGLTDIACELLNPFVEEADKDRRTDLKSTEELCSEIKSVNEKMMKDGMRRGTFQQTGNLVVGSKDVKAFYPNIDVDVAADEAKIEIEESDIEMEMNPTEVALFLACAMSQEEIDAEELTDVVHRRRCKKGPRPGLTCKAITGGPEAKSKDKSWLPPQEAAWGCTEAKDAGLPCKMHNKVSYEKSLLHF